MPVGVGRTGLVCSSRECGQPVSLPRSGSSRVASSAASVACEAARSAGRGPGRPAGASASGAPGVGPGCVPRGRGRPARPCRPAPGPPSSVPSPSSPPVSVRALISAAESQAARPTPRPLTAAMP
ncbi:hypothetical protein DMA15_29590 [Streptomyces sp. WAC 01529]|nr:hypothetical protein DMA15_29590 [Streptomyces sp. WAC 01529]